MQKIKTNIVTRATASLNQEIQQELEVEDPKETEKSIGTGASGDNQDCVQKDSP